MEIEISRGLVSIKTICFFSKLASLLVLYVPTGLQLSKLKKKTKWRKHCLAYSWLVGVRFPSTIVLLLLAYRYTLKLKTIQETRDTEGSRQHAGRLDSSALCQTTPLICYYIQISYLSSSLSCSDVHALSKTTADTLFLQNYVCESGVRSDNFAEKFASPFLLLFSSLSQSEMWLTDRLTCTTTAIDSCYSAVERSRQRQPD